jgi:hypothetical protein
VGGDVRTKPDWCDWWSADEWKRFETTLRVLDKENRYVTNSGDADLRILAEAVREAPAGKWSVTIKEYVSRSQQVDPAGADTADFEEIRKNLRVRLYPESMELPGGEERIRRVVAPGLAEIAVIDQPTMVQTPTTSTTDAWPLTADEILEQGRANVRAGERLALGNYDFDGITIMRGFLDDYASAHALWLDDYPVLGEYGALVSIPVEGELYVYPLDGGHNLIEAQNTLVEFGLFRQEQEPRPISHNIYHWDHERFEKEEDPALAAEFGQACPLYLAMRVTREEADQKIVCHIEPEYQRLMEQLL